MEFTTAVVPKRQVLMSSLQILEQTLSKHDDPVCFGRCVSRIQEYWYHTKWQRTLLYVQTTLLTNDNSSLIIKCIKTCRSYIQIQIHILNVIVFSNSIVYLIRKIT